MKQLMTGNEAISRGAWEAGVTYAAAYPGTPSSEIIETAANYKEIRAELAPNEKVALESVVGASIAGARALASMKHVGLNVAADPFFTFSYIGVTGGVVIVTADEPGQHSSQNEQDNRNYAKFAKVPLFEPADSAECKDMLIEAFDLSEEYDTPVLFRTTTRVNHGKGLVEPGERREVPVKPYKKDLAKYNCVPMVSRALRVRVEERTLRLRAYSNTTKWNREEMHSKDIGVIASGVSYQYAREVFGDDASYLKLGFTYPLPDEMIRAFAGKVKKLYIIEENDPYIEEFVRALGIACYGKDIFPSYGEMLPDVIRGVLEGTKPQNDPEVAAAVIKRAPTLCAGCPHRGFFYELGKRRNVMVAGDIGCYSLAYAEPYNAMDTSLCMGASISMGHGAQTVFNSVPGNKMRVVSVLGDSTFIHSGITSLIDVIYNKSNTVNVILDNRITAMTGQQENPTTGLTLQEEPTNALDIRKLVEALGFRNIRTIDPNQLSEVKDALDWALALNEASVIITRWPCALKKQSDMDKEEFPGSFLGCYYVDQETCIGCRICTRTGCPAISFDPQAKKASIDPDKCVGCSVCAQACPTKSIKEGGR